MIRFTLDGVKHEFDDDRMLNTDVRAAKKVTGYGYVEFWNQFGEMDDDVITCIVWLTLRKENPELSFSAVEFSFSEFIQSMESDKVEGETDDEPDPPVDDVNPSTPST